MKFIVDNMTCNHCKMKIENALKKIKVKKIEFDMENRTVFVAVKKQSTEDVQKAVTEIGYHFQLVEA